MTTENSNTERDEIIRTHALADIAITALSAKNLCNLAIDGALDANDHQSLLTALEVMISKIGWLAEESKNSIRLVGDANSWLAPPEFLNGKEAL